MNRQRRLFLAFILFVLADLLALGQDCGNIGNYTRNSAYSVNLNASLSSLYNNIDSNGFYYASVGQGLDRANAMVLCRGDLQLDECRDCVQEASARLLRSCPAQKEAIRGWDDRCMLRYSNKTIYNIRLTRPRYWWWNTENATNSDRFKNDLRTLVDGLRDQAASGGSLRKVAAGNTTGPDFLTIFALVQCTPDLPRQECSNCLLTAAADIPRCCDGKRGGRVRTPSCYLRFEIYDFFNGTRLQELESAPGPEVEPPSQPSPEGKGDGNTARTAIIVVVSIVSSLILAVLAIIWIRKRNKHSLIEDRDERDVEEISTAESLQYAFSTIKAATNDFSDDNKLGQGGFGTVHKGKLPNGTEIAVKRLSKNSGQGDMEFKNEVLLLVKLQHRNLVRLLGFALEGKEKLLVYEFVQNASLDLFIFGQTNHSSYLDWDRRYKIIVGIARGILYLHEDSRLRIIHRDLKAGNILLDGDMNPKIADFGMARLFGQDESQGNTSRIVGTYGYMPPEYLMHGQFSSKSDVFSFGVLVLEIISGQKNNSFRSGDTAQDLLTYYAWKNWREGTAVNVVDPLLVSGSGVSGSIRDMLRCIHVGLLCVQENAADRPTMASVLLMLSSSSITLAVPSEPAFYFPSGFGSDVLRLQEDSWRTPEHNSTSSGRADQSDHSSQNDVSISEMYPR